jgi:hypothetical protein
MQLSEPELSALKGVPHVRTADGQLSGHDPVCLYGESRAVGARRVRWDPSGRPRSRPRKTHPRCQWLLAPFYFSIRQSNVIQRRIVFDSHGPLSILVEQLPLRGNSEKNRRLRPRTSAFQIGHAACWILGEPGVFMNIFARRSRPKPA